MDTPEMQQGAYIARKRCMGIIEHGVSYDLSLLRIAESCYLQGIEDAATALAMKHPNLFDREVDP